MEIKQNLTNINFNKRNGRTIKYIVVHYTGNSTDTAYNNTRYFKNVNRNASAHYFVDDNSIWQCVLDKDVSWHCGDKLKSGNGGAFYQKCTNYNSIGVEMCCTNYDISSKTEANTIELVKMLMSKYGIPANNVIRHYDVTNKNCPKPFVENPSRWQAFKSKLGGSSQPVTPSTQGITGDIKYQSYDNSKNRWLPEVINDRDYAGNLGHSLGGVRIKPTYGEIRYSVHILGGGWLSNVSSYNYKTNDTRDGNSYAGIYHKAIDGVRIESTQGYVSYRVHTKGGNWLPWVDSRTKSGSESYAGIYGKCIDGIQMK